MALNDIIFQKQNGGMGRRSANEDVISGLVLSMNGKLTGGDLSQFDPVSVGADTLYMAKLTFYEQLLNLYGIDKTDTPATDTEKANNAIDYHVSEFFRMSPTGTLYAAVRLTGEVTGADIQAVQNYAGGVIRQMGLMTESDANIADYQTAATALEADHCPLSIVFTTDGTGQLLTDFIATNTKIVAGRCNVSELIGCDLSPALLQRLGTTAGTFGAYGCIGTALGALSAASVHESIAWVGKFPLSLVLPGFITGELIKTVPTSTQSLINDGRYIFVRTHAGIANNYFNDSFTYDLTTSDYAFIENERTIDKAVRGIRSYMLPTLNAPIYVDADTGKLRADTVAVLENTAGKALEEMEKAGELSGYRAEIDPEQNIIATSQLEIIIRNVPVGVLRRVLIKIGYTVSMDN